MSTVARTRVMGSQASRLRNSLRSGDETAAVKTWHELVPNGVPPANGSLPLELTAADEDGNDLLHHAAMGAMSKMVELLLAASFDPSRANAQGRNVLHMLCDLSSAPSRSSISAVFATPPTASPGADKQRAYLIDLVLVRARDMEKVDGQAVCQAADKAGMSPLHLAAVSGLYHCGVHLLNNGACPFARNHGDATPCDIAVQRRQHRMALLLSSKMVFSHGASGAEELDTAECRKLGSANGYRGLHTQEIIEIKDKLLLETADMLHVPLHVAGVLLRQRNWSREALMDAWLQDSADVLKQASLSEDVIQQPSANEHSLVLPTSPSATAASAGAVQECGICFCEMLQKNSPAAPCGHRFCTDCWKEFLAGKIEEGSADNIPCPSTECDAAVPVELVDHLMPREMRRRYDHFDVKAFVAGMENIRWCPMPHCDRAVEVEPSGEWFALSKGAMLVDCGDNHAMCWQCGEQAHEPCTCEMVREWQGLSQELAKEDADYAARNAAHEKAANDAWMAGNSKPCPKCSAPIERTHGCNHMTCRRCRYEFCWMCMGEWKLHSNATGGYFRCTREEAKKHKEKHEEQLSKFKETSSEAEQKALLSTQFRKVQEHKESLTKHHADLLVAGQRLSALVVEVEKCGSGQGLKTRYLELVFKELVLAHQALLSSCIYRYFLEKSTPKKRSGELSLKVTMYSDLQGHLETATADLCKMVDVVYLQSSQPAIVKQTLLVRSRRLELVETVHNGILPEGVAEDIEAEEERARNPLRLPFFFRRRHGSGSSNSSDEGGGEHVGHDGDFDLTALRHLFLQHLLRDNDQPICERLGCSQPRTGDAGRFCSGNCALLSQVEESDEERSPSWGSEPDSPVLPPRLLPQSSAQADPAATNGSSMFLRRREGDSSATNGPSMFVRRRDGDSPVPPAGRHQPMQPPTREPVRHAPVPDRVLLEPQERTLRPFLPNFGRSSTPPPQPPSLARPGMLPVAWAAPEEDSAESRARAQPDPPRRSHADLSSYNSILRSPSPEPSPPVRHRQPLPRWRRQPSPPVLPRLQHSSGPRLPSHPSMAVSNAGPHAQPAIVSPSLRRSRQTFPGEGYRPNAIAPAAPVQMSHRLSDVDNIFDDNAASAAASAASHVPGHDFDMDLARAIALSLGENPDQPAPATGAARRDISNSQARTPVQSLV